MDQMRGNDCKLDPAYFAHSLEVVHKGKQKIQIIHVYLLQ